MLCHVIRTDSQLSLLLASARKERGWTQTDFARRLGVSQQLVSGIERNVNCTTASRLLCALRILGFQMTLTLQSEKQDASCAENTEER
jgi:transcriptional regulator with XRE-family HTH domain